MLWATSVSLVDRGRHVRCRNRGLGGSYVNKLVLQAPAGLWLDDAIPPDSFTMSPDEITRAAYYDPDAAQARLPAPDPDDKEAIAKATFERQKAGIATAKFIWPIWDKGLKKRIHRIKAPTLLVWGESDGLVPPIYGEEFKRLIPGSKLVIIPKAGHVPSFEQRDEYVRILRDFCPPNDQAEANQIWPRPQGAACERLSVNNPHSCWPQPQAVPNGLYDRRSKSPSGASGLPRDRG
jgi:hypothetical protein